MFAVRAKNACTTSFTLLVVVVRDGRQTMETVNKGGNGKIDEKRQANTAIHTLNFCIKTGLDRNADLSGRIRRVCSVYMRRWVDVRQPYLLGGAAEKPTRGGRDEDQIEKEKETRSMRALVISFTLCPCNVRKAPTRNCSVASRCASVSKRNNSWQRRASQFSREKPARRYAERVISQE